MKKINFKSVSSTLSQKEMKNVTGGSGYCSNLWSVISNNPHILLDPGTCAGAAHGASLCGWTINC